jgi:hypothetical protein
MAIGAGMAISRLVSTVIVESRALIPRNRKMFAPGFLTASKCIGALNRA